MALTKVAFPNTDRSGFSEVIKQRVAAYFQAAGISRHANVKMVAKTCFYVGGFEFIGACTYTWRIRHNLIHHTYTNIVGSDGDLESMPLLRFCVKPGRKWFHRYQHFYAPLLYCFASLVWIVKKDFVHILEERRDQRLGRKPPVHTYFSLIFLKPYI